MRRAKSQPYIQHRPPDGDSILCQHFQRRNRAAKYVVGKPSHSQGSVQSEHLDQRIGHGLHLPTMTGAFGKNEIRRRHRQCPSTPVFDLLCHRHNLPGNSYRPPTRLFASRFPASTTPNPEKKKPPAFCGRL